MPRQTRKPDPEGDNLVIDLQWTKEMEEVMFNELYRQDQLGKRADAGFKAEAWTVVLEKVQEVYTGPLTIAQLKSKEGWYRGAFKDWKWLKDQSGFNYDEATGMIVAAREAWDEVIKVAFHLFYKGRYSYILLQHHKSCRWHRNNRLYFTDILEELYATVLAVGTAARSLHTSGPVNSDSQLSNIDPFLLSDSPSTSQPSTPSTVPISYKRRRGIEREDTKAKKTARSDTNNGLNSLAKAIFATVDRSRLGEAIQALQEDYSNRLTDDDIQSAIDCLAKDRQAIIFLSLIPGVVRDRWLERSANVTVLLGEDERECSPV